MREHCGRLPALDHIIGAQKGRLSRNWLRLLGLRANAWAVPVPCANGCKRVLRSAITFTSPRMATSGWDKTKMSLCGSHARLRYLQANSPGDLDVRVTIAVHASVPITSRASAISFASNNRAAAVTSSFFNTDINDDGRSYAKRVVPLSISS